jgi:hypothetical protein
MLRDAALAGMIIVGPSPNKGKRNKASILATVPPIGQPAVNLQEVVHSIRFAKLMSPNVSDPRGSEPNGHPQQCPPHAKGSRGHGPRRRTVAYFHALGVRITRVMTDNGSCYRSRAFAKACRDLDIKHLRTKPYTPQTNGKAERFVQTALRE